MESAKDLIAKLEQIEREDLEHLKAEHDALLAKYDAMLVPEMILRTGMLPEVRWYFTKKR